MHAVFVACLFGGAVATALFALLGFAGGGGGHAHIGQAHSGHLHVGHGPSHVGATHSAAQPSSGHVGHAVSTHGSHGGTAKAVAPSHTPIWSSLGWALSWLSPLALAAAALWFGAAGLIAEGNRLALLIAMIAALVGAALVRGVMNAFVRSSTPPLQLTAEGAIGVVNSTIRPGASGEVLFTVENLHRSIPARSEEGITIPRGTEVVITRREGGFAWVEPLQPLDDFSAAPYPSDSTPAPGSGA